MDEVKVTKLINGPEAFTPDNEFCLGETEVRGLFVAAGFCAHGLAGAGGIGKVMAEWIAEGEPSLDLWEMDMRRFGAQYRSPSYTHARIRETYETYYDIRYPNHERRPGGRCGSRPPTPGTREHGAAFGEKSGWERVNWYEWNAGRGRRVAAAARLGGPALVARDRRRAPRHPRGGRALRRVLVREDGDRGPGGGGAARAPLRQPGRPRRRAGSPTRRCSTARGGIECDFTVARLAEERFSIVTGTAFGNHDREWIRKHLPEEGGVQVHDVTSRWSCFGIWGPRARDVLAPLTPAGPRQRGVPLHDAARDHGRRRAGAGAARHLRRRARLGALLPDRVRAGAVAGAVGGGRAARHRRRRLPGDRLDAAREGLPRLGRRHHPRRDARTRAASASASSSTRRAASSAARRWSRRRSAGPRSRLCCLCSRTRARSRSATSRCGSAARSPAG